MLDQLMNSLKSEVAGQITSQTNLPACHLDKVISVLGLQDLFGGGKDLGDAAKNLLGSLLK